MSTKLRRVVSCTAKRCRWRQKDADSLRRSVASGLGGGKDEPELSSGSLAGGLLGDKKTGSSSGGNSSSSPAVNRTGSDSMTTLAVSGADDAFLHTTTSRLNARNGGCKDPGYSQSSNDLLSSPPAIVFNHMTSNSQSHSQSSIDSTSMESKIFGKDPLPLMHESTMNSRLHRGSSENNDANEWATSTESAAARHNYRSAKSVRVPDIKYNDAMPPPTGGRRFSRQRSLSVDSVDIKERLISSMLVNRTSRLDEDDDGFAPISALPPHPPSPSLPLRLGRRRSGKLLTTPENNQGLSRRGHSQKVSKKSFKGSPDRKEKRKKTMDVNALFQAIDEQSLERCRDILQSTQIDVNSLNEDQFTPLDLALLSGQTDIARILFRYGAQENPQFQSSVDTRAMVIVRLVAKAETHIADIRALMNTVASSQAKELDKSLRHWEMCLFRYRAMKMCFESAVLPGQVTNMSLSVVSDSSVRVCFDEPTETGNTLITRYKVEWSCTADFQPVLGQQILEDIFYRSFEISDLCCGRAYYVRVSAANMKGFGVPAVSDPPYIVPSSWRDAVSVKRRGEGVIQQLDELFTVIRDSRPPDSSPITDVISPNCSPLMPRKSNVKQSLRNLFAVTPKFCRNLNRGVYLCCILYHRDRVLVTYDEYPPIVEVDENFPSNLGLAAELHWLMKVALKWCDIKALRQDVDKSVSSGAMHFRSKVLQAILLQQNATGVTNLGQFYHSPLRDSTGSGPVVLLCTNSVRDPKTVNTNNVRWVSRSKLNVFIRPSEETGIQLVSAIEDAIQYHKACQDVLTKGLYVGYLQLKSTVDSISIVTPRLQPNMLPHVKVRDISHITREEWEWLQQLRTNQMSSFGTARQLIFHDTLTAAVKTLLEELGVPDDDVASHRLYDAEVFELSDEVSVIMVLPSTDLVCSVPGVGENVHCSRNNKFTCLPLQVFELNLMTSYQRSFAGRFCRLSSILDVDTHLAQQTLREAFTGSELTVAKSRVLQLAGFQHSLDELWRSMRWTMDVITFARDRSAVGGLPLGIFFAPPQQVIERALTHSSAVSSTPRQVSADVDPITPSWTNEASSASLWSFSDCGYQSDGSSMGNSTATANKGGCTAGGSCGFPTSVPLPLGVHCSCLCARNSSLDESDLVWLRQKSATSLSDTVRVYVAYPTGLAGSPCVKLQANAQTTSRDIINLVVQQTNRAAATVPAQKGVAYSDEELANFCLVCVVGVRERVLRDDFAPLRLQPPWSKGRLFVRLKSQLLAALDHRQVTLV